MSFINFRNFEAPKQRKISKTELLEALLKYETKNKKKVESLLESFGEEIEFADAINAFSNKTAAITALSIVESKPGPDPYMTGLDDETEEEKEDQMKDQAEMDDDDPEAYKEMPGDEEAREEGKVKTSKHTKAYDELYGDDEEQNEAEVKGEEVALPAEEIEAEDKKVNTEADKKTTDTSAELEADLEGTADGAGKEVVESSLNEGQFSWMTQDTGEQIGSESENTITVYMYDNEGNRWEEKRYEGYGEFGGMDYYALLDKMNGGEGDREAGIKLAFDKKKAKAGKVLFPALVTDPRYNWKRHNFKVEADNDPNQSWYQEKEYDGAWYDSAKPKLSWDSLIEKINEMDINEWGSSDQSAMNKSIHSGAGKPKTMPSPFDKKLRAAAENAVDFYWDDWAEYETDRDGLIDNAVRSYLRSYFRKDWDIMVRMFEPVDEIESSRVKLDEAFIGPFVFNDNTSDEELLGMYNGALDGYANYSKGMYHSKSDYKKAYQEIEKMLKKRGISTDESVVTEAKFVKDFNREVLKAKTKEEVLELYPNAEFFIGKSDHFFGELDDNLFFKAYYTKAQEEFEIKSVYSEKGSNYVHLYNESVVAEAGINDPVLMAFRAAKMKREKELAKPKRRPLYGKQREKAEETLWVISQDLKDLYADRGQLLIDMEQEAEAEGGPVADRYGEQLNMIEDKIASLIQQRNKLEMKLAEAFVSEDSEEVIESSEVEEIVESNWGTYSTPEGKQADKKLDKAFAKFKAAVSKAHATYRDEIKGLSSSDLGNKSGFNDSEGGMAVAGYLQHFVKSEFMMSDYGDISRFDYMKGMYEGKIIEEGRSIGKIQKEWGNVTAIMKDTVAKYKTAEGQEKEDLLDELKSLTSAKKKLEAELDAAVGLKDLDAELAESLDVTGLSQKILGQLDTFGQLHINYVAPEVLTTIEDVLSKYRSLRGGKLTQKIATEVRNALEDTGNLAGDAYRHIKDIDYIIADALSESKLNEDLRSDLKKYIKKNKKELDQLADEDNWDGIYQMLINDFSVDSDSEDAEELKTVFNIVY